MTTYLLNKTLKNKQISLIEEVRLIFKINTMNSSLHLIQSINNFKIAI